MANTQFDPQWYLMHHTDPNAYIGPFETESMAHLYRKIRVLGHYAVVRTSKPKQAETPKESDRKWYAVLRNDWIGPFATAQLAGRWRFKKNSNHRVASSTFAVSRLYRQIGEWV